MRNASLLVLACLLFAPLARADVLVFKNGDRWTGTIVSMEDGRVRFRTELVGQLQVNFAQVETFSSDRQIEIHLTDGTVLIDAVAAAEPGTFRTAGQGKPGELVLDLAETTAINPVEARWRGSVMVGAELERGNTYKNSGYAQLRAGFQSESHRIDLRGSYEGERTKNKDTREGTTQDRNIFGRLKYDYLYTQRDFWYLATSGEKDGPSDLDLRAIVSTGLGRDFYNRADFKLQIYAGPTFISEHFKDSDDDDEQRVGATLGWDAVYEIIPDLDFFTDGTYTQSSTDDILVKSEVGLRNDLTDSIFIEAKILWEYDSEPAKDAERQDTDYIFGIGYKF
jgi:putative salt-induced outer membrane protein YdiY